MNNYFVLLLLIAKIIQTISDSNWKEINFEADKISNKLFNKSFEIYSKNNLNSTLNFIEKLAIYQSVDDEKQYKIHFVDLKNKNFTIHEYTIFPSFSKNGTKINFISIIKKDYYIIGRLAFNDARFTIFKNILCRETNGNNEEYPRVITSIDVVDSFNSFYFIIKYRNFYHKEIIRIARQNKDTNKYELFGRFVD